MTMHTRFGWLAFLVGLAIAPRIGEAQLAPMGTHYAGRPSDTGFTGPNESGGYSATVPLELPTARGDLPIPLAIVSGPARYGAAGVGWDIPLSYVYIDTSLVHRRPSMKPDAAATARKRITLSLFGRSVEMLQRAENDWIGRNAPDLELRHDGSTWTLFDGNGLSYVFSGYGNLAGAGGPWVGEHSLLLLSRITGKGGASVRLSYDVGLQTVTPGDVTPAATIDLVSLEYNPHPSGACFKTTVSLGYARHAPPTAPDAISVLGTRVIARYSHLTSVVVQSRANCSTSPETLRTYEFKYESPDADTRQDRLSSVTVRGRQLPSEPNIPLPVAAFKYGVASTSSATGEPTLTFVPQENVPLPAGAKDGFAITEKIFAGYQSRYDSAPNAYAATQMLVDMTGDGRADFVYRSNGQLLIARNVAGPNGTVTFTNPVPLTDTIFKQTFLDIRTLQFDRFSSGHSDNDLNREYVWTQTIDVNGDGRLDVIDASEVPGYWAVYLNTPSSAPSGIAWVRREFDIRGIYSRLAGRGFKIKSGYLPLALRTTGHDYLVSTCWKKENGTYVAHGNLQDLVSCPQVEPHWTPASPLALQATITEWEIKDMNGDGFPDLIANSDPVDFVPQPYGGEPPQYYSPDKFLGAEYRKFGITTRDDRSATIDVAFNVVGVFFESATLPFSAFQPLHPDYADGDRCGIATWTAMAASRDSQHVACDIEDINGDGLPDRISNTTALLGNGVDFSTTRITLAAGLRRQHSLWLQDCDAHDTFYSWERDGLRDLTGDGIPDQLDNDGVQTKLYPGTSAGFESVRALFGATVPSFQEEECHGVWSRTMGGLVDLDGDGRADWVKYNAGTPKTLTISRLQGGASSNNLDSSRLVQIDNGHGASTRITYRSAKNDSTTKHQVASPEIVVDKIETVDSSGKPLIAATSYAYGDIDTWFDSAADAFRPTGYLRRVELVVGEIDAAGAPQANATITDLYGLEPASTSSFISMSPAARYGRYLRIGQPLSTTVLSGRVSANPWDLLTVDVTTDPRRIAKTDYAVEMTSTRWFDDVLKSTETCVDMAFPYHFNISSAAANPTTGFNPCTARGFLHATTIGSWRGSDAPPSANNVQTFTQLLKEDDLGHPIKVSYKNDVTQWDDDYCVETTYVRPPAPQPGGPAPRILHAPASRRVTDCGTKNIVFAEESFDYDNQLNTIATDGLLTGHTVYRHATDTGQWLSTIRDVNIRYDANANPIKLERWRDDNAYRSVSLAYDEFALVPTTTITSGTGVQTLTKSSEIDPVTGAVVTTTDPNGVKTEVGYDGFGRPTSTTVPNPSGAGRGVIALRQYLGFAGDDPKGRRVVTKQFIDPVPLQDVPLAEARTSTTFLDQLGRVQQTAVDLGDDYAHQSLIVGDRTFDLLGRVDFEADPYPSTQRSLSVYGTTRFYNLDGTLAAEIRGNGKQTFTRVPDPQREVFPYLYEHGFADHLERVRVRTPDSLTPGSPQADVSRETLTTAIGRVVSRATWQGSARIEFAEMGYDALGDVTRFSRYYNPVTPANPVSWTSRFDSLGQLLELNEPSVSTQTRTYSDFGELKAISWAPQAPYQTREIANEYDAYGRLTASKEKNDGVIDPATAVGYWYDEPHATSLLSPTNVHGRLAFASSPSGAVALSYDAFGNLAGRSYFDDATNEYSEGYEYHADGSLSSLTLKLPDNGHRAERVSYAYDSAGRTSSMWFDDGVNTRDLYSVTNDVFGRIRDASFGDGNANVFHADYADAGRRLPMRMNLTTPSGMRAIHFDTFDALGREVDRREDRGTYEDKYTSSFDRLGQLSRTQRYHNNVLADTSSFTYDTLGNVRTLQGGGSIATLAYDSTDRDRACSVNYSLVPYPVCNFRYDNLGSVTSMRTPSGTRTLSYFNSGAVRSITRGTTTAQFSYDAQGNIAKLDITSGASLLRSDRNFGPYITARTQSGPFGLASFISRKFPGPGVAITRRGATGPWVYEFAEERGTRFTVDDNGEFKQEVAYSPFGIATSTGAGAGDLTFTTAQWNGGDALDGLGVVQVGARIYDPMIGRFLSRDPLMIPRGATTSNPYAFAWNDPMNGSDPSGLDPFSFMMGVQGYGSGQQSSSGVGIMGSIALGFAYSALHSTHGQSSPAGAPQTLQGRLLFGVTSFYLSGRAVPGFNWDSLAASGIGPGEAYGIAQEAYATVYQPRQLSTGDRVALGAQAIPYVGDYFALTISLHQFASAPSWDSWFNLQLDGIGAALPVVPALGSINRAWSEERVVERVVEGEVRSPGIGGGASLSNISPSEAIRIQNAADRIGVPIALVGSRANGTASAFSDWDYVINASGRKLHSVSTSLPGASTLERLPNVVDIFRGSVDMSKPHIIFYPR